MSIKRVLYCLAEENLGLGTRHIYVMYIAGGSGKKPKQNFVVAAVCDILVAHC